MKKVYAIAAIGCLVGALTTFPAHSGISSVCGNFYQVDPAPEPTPITPRCQVRDNVMYIDGAVDEFLQFELEYFWPEVTHIELNSHGGEVNSMFAIAELIRERNITTNVREGAVCGSACTLLYQAGVYRTAHHSSWFLYHGTRIGSIGMRSWRRICSSEGLDECTKWIIDRVNYNKDLTNNLFQAYVDFGASPQLYEDFRSAGEDENWFLNGNFTRTRDFVITAEQALQYNIVQEIVN